MRVLVSGSRSWQAWEIIWADLDQMLAEARRLGQPMVLVHGACPRGADRMAQEWAELRISQGVTGLTVERHPADWERYGRKVAGGVRNRKMAELGADRVLIYIHDDSPGATGMLKLARRLGLRRSLRMRYGENWDAPFLAPLRFEEMDEPLPGLG